MRIVVLICVLVAAVAARPEELAFYNPAYDSFNAQEVAGNIRLLKHYGKCFLDEGPCTSEGADFKKAIPEALRTSCERCTPKQKELIRTVVEAFKTKLPNVWEQLVKKNDPDLKYKASFDKFLEGDD